jgi:hypothetical protein
MACLCRIKQQDRFNDQLDWTEITIKAEVAVGTRDVLEARVTGGALGSHISTNVLEESGQISHVGRIDPSAVFPVVWSVGIISHRIRLI